MEQEFYESINWGRTWKAAALLSVKPYYIAWHSSSCCYSNHGSRTLQGCGATAAVFVWRNETAHDAHRYTLAERCGKHANGKQGAPYGAGEMRKGLAVAHDYFLELEADELEWTQGKSGPQTVMPQAIERGAAGQVHAFLTRV